MSNKDKLKKVVSLLNTQWDNIEQIDGNNGGNSWVFKVSSSQEESQAIKIFRRITELNRYARFKDEVATVEILQKSISGICRILDKNLPDKPSLENEILQLPYLIMPYYPFGSIEKELKLLQDDGNGVMKVFKNIVEIVQKIHEKGYAHRDLKPENILRISEEEICISDFGLCLDLNKTNEDRQTTTTEIIGSFYYRAPEYLRGKLDESDHRQGDIFSLGRILWSLLYGTQPIGLTDWEFSERKISQLVPNLKKSYIIDDLIASCTEFDPSKRPTIGVVLEVVNQWIQESAAGSLQLFIEEVQGSKDILDEKENQRTVSELGLKCSEFSNHVDTHISRHEIFKQLKKIHVVSELLDRNPDWPKFLGTVVNDELISGGILPQFTFSTGSNQYPSVEFGCIFYIDEQKMTILSQVAVALVDNNNLNDHWKSEIFELESCDAEFLKKVRSAIDSSMQKVETWLGAYTK